MINDVSNNKYIILLEMEKKIKYIYDIINTLQKISKKLQKLYICNLSSELDIHRWIKQDDTRTKLLIEVLEDELTNIKIKYNTLLEENEWLRTK